MNDTANDLVNELERLADPQSRDRAQLARLRSALIPGRELEALAIVMPFVRADGQGPRQLERAEDTALLVAGLFAMFPQHHGKLSLATAMRKVAGAQDGGSVEQRFRALLTASQSELRVHLRYAVSLVAGQDGIPGIDYVDLHRAIRWWDHENGHARRRWAREFWAPMGAEPKTSDEPE